MDYIEANESSRHYDWKDEINMKLVNIDYCNLFH